MGTLLDAYDLPPPAILMAYNPSYYRYRTRPRGRGQAASTTGLARALLDAAGSGG